MMKNWQQKFSLPELSIPAFEYMERHGKDEDCPMPKPRKNLLSIYNASELYRFYCSDGAVCDGFKYVLTIGKKHLGSFLSHFNMPTHAMPNCQICILMFLAK